LGTASIEKNEMLSAYLSKAGVQHELLNAKNHAREAEIIAEAGRKGAVTVATNMAGRGVDIKLGGLDATPELREEIRALGGLCVIGTERHESRRIDNQLRGRSGRQGDPGFTQFYVSMEDDLIRIFGGERMRNLMNTLGIPDDQPIESGMITSSLEKAQQRVEGHNFDTRKRVLDYDEVLNKHRRSVYGRRFSILQDEAFDVITEMRDMIEREAEHTVLFHTGDSIQMEVVPELPDQEVEGDRDSKEIIESLQTLCALPETTVQGLQLILKDISRNKEVLAGQRDEVLTTFMAIVEKELEHAKQALGEKELKVMFRRLMLRAIDQAWVEHLETMQYLRRSIGLRSYGQRDPLVEYNREAFNVFNLMQEEVDRQVATTAMRIVKQSIETNKILDTAPSVMERAKVILQGASETMERKESATQEKRARRAATQLLSQQQQRMGGGLSDERRAELRKKRK
jgi:preprotein translocase subunit SecA